jgi:hypothetical protein
MPQRAEYIICMHPAKVYCAMPTVVVSITQVQGPLKRMTCVRPPERKRLKLR